jgi:hypothetical protein
MGRLQAAFETPPGARLVLWDAPPAGMTPGDIARAPRRSWLCILNFLHPALQLSPR